MRTPTAIVFSTLVFGLLFYFFSSAPAQAATFSVAVSADDVQFGGGALQQTNIATFDAGNITGPGIHGAEARFANINIPQGSTINSAKLTVTARSAGAGTNFLSKIYAENVDNSDTIDDTAEFNSASLTAGTAWTSASTWTAGQPYDSPDISSEIQTVVNRAGWASGNAVGIFWKDDSSSGNNYRLAASWDNATYTDEPKLIITWTEPGAPDTSPPTRSGGAPTGSLSAGTTQNSISLNTNENATCRYSTTAGTSYSSMANTFSTTGGTSHSTQATGLANGQTYNYYVRCQDTAATPNVNTDDYTITFNVLSPGGPNPPIRSNGLPSGVLPEGTTQTNISFNTNEPATCRYAITTGINYDLMNNFFTADVGGTIHSVTVSGLTAGMHNYYVRCVDGVGDKNTNDFMISFTISGVPDVIPPVRTSGAPAGLLPANTLQTNLTFKTDESAACRYATTTAIAYASMTKNFIATAGTSHSAQITGLTRGTSYNYYIRCQDAVGNSNTADYVISFSVAVPSDFEVSGVNIPSLLQDRANTFQIQGSNFDIAADFYISFTRDSAEAYTFTAKPVNGSTIELNFSSDQISALPPGLYNLKVERASDNLYQVYSKQILITVPGDIWSPNSTDASEPKGDGRVDIYDVSRLLSKWGSALSADLAEADISSGTSNVSAGKIDIYDLNLMMSNWRS